MEDKNHVWQQTTSEKPNSVKLTFSLVPFSSRQRLLADGTANLLSE